MHHISSSLETAGKIKEVKQSETATNEGFPARRAGKLKSTFYAVR